jgi:hypothetical protein
VLGAVGGPVRSGAGGLGSHAAGGQPRNDGAGPAPSGARGPGWWTLACHRGAALLAWLRLSVVGRTVVYGCYLASLASLGLAAPIRLGVEVVCGGCLTLLARLGLALLIGLDVTVLCERCLMLLAWHSVTVVGLCRLAQVACRGTVQVGLFVRKLLACLGPAVMYHRGLAVVCRHGVMSLRWRGTMQVAGRGRTRVAGRDIRRVTRRDRTLLGRLGATVVHQDGLARVAHRRVMVVPGLFATVVVCRDGVAMVAGHGVTPMDRKEPGARCNRRRRAELEKRLGRLGVQLVEEEGHAIPRENHRSGQARCGQGTAGGIRRSGRKQASCLRGTGTMGSGSAMIRIGPRWIRGHWPLSPGNGLSRALQKRWPSPSLSPSRRGRAGVESGGLRPGPAHYFDYVWAAVGNV